MFMFYQLKPNFFLYVFILLSFGSFSCFAQMEVSKDSTELKNVIKNMPSFTIYGDNYFIAGTTLGETPTSNNSDGKLQIGFKQRLTNKTLPLDTYLFFTYRQTAFWDVFKQSFPFRETNYNPSVALIKPFYKNGQYNGTFQLEYEHESNGLSADSSRSWNRISFKHIRYLADNLTGTLKVWLPVGNMDDNSDITDFRGYQQLDLAYKMDEHFIFETEIRKSFDFNWKGSLMLGANYRISDQSDQFIYLQYYLGYSENLITYDQSTHRLRIGFVFKDLFLKFRK